MSDIIINEDLIKKIKKSHSDRAIHEWLVKEPRTVSQLVIKYPSLLMWSFNYCKDLFNIITQEQIEYCIKNAPGYALLYYHSKLTATQFNYCVDKCPSTALEFFKTKLTLDQVADCESKITNKLTMRN